MKQFVKNYKGHTISQDPEEMQFYVDEFETAYETCMVAENFIDTMEFKFEVGKIYRSWNDQNYIKITGRTATGFLTFVHLSVRDGSEYQLGFKRKKPSIWGKLESLHLAIGYGVGYPAYNVLTQEEFDAIVKENVEKANREARECEEAKERRYAEEYIKLKATLKEYDISLETLEKLWEAYETTSAVVIEKMKEEEKNA